MQRPSREEIGSFLKSLQNKIIQSFETLEPTKRFEYKPWEYKTGGGGVIGSLRGDHFEKAAVNFSEVSGPKLPLKKEPMPFFATGVSLITHMANPHASTVHMNVRYIETKDRFWFGGGYDLTPMGVFYEEDKQHFHKEAKDALDELDPTLYPKFSKNAAEYFYIPHRKKERGVGGLFFDYFNTGDLVHDLRVWKGVGESFLKAIMPIYKTRVHTPFSKEEKEEQLKLRGHYVEFNLIYDRGTRFGFESGGNPEAILSSMPPLVSW